MDIKQTQYIIQDYITEKDPELYSVTEHDFGFWQDENDSYDTYEEALETLEDSASHMPLLMRIVVRTTTVTTTENVLYRYTPEREAHEE
jgi:hypothetical protein